MAKYTEYLRLVKPEGNEYYNVEQFNQNAELIDKETKKLSDGLTRIQEGATREKAGIVQYGTEEGKALEGMMLARIFGCVGYGGDIQTAGVKDINYIYYDRNTRKMYKCLNQNSDVSANVANFIPLDNNSLLDRLENLISSRNEGRNTILKIGNVVIENITIPGTVGIRTAILKTSFKNIISVSLTSYITYGQQVDSIQSIHDSNSYILSNKSLRFYCNGNQTVDICVIGLI
ncbi:hypothetical protein [Fusobacterium polymorphum]|uniref:hypothetical protein n=1 Tax=Fusobacterium nucleatum subsp. polymorphum TaxID=76857 RepID=UPI0021C3A211|nr:hypothetical protein [Fusobacterium polymorphum]